MLNRRLDVHAPLFEIRHLRYFIATAEYGSFRKAGRALAIQESSISRRVRDLEDALGASLFQRHSNGVSLTLAGERFLDHARDGLRQIEAGARDVAAIGRSEDGHIKIGIFSSLASVFFPELLQTYSSCCPGVSVDLVDGDLWDHVAAIRQFRLDVAFIAGTAAWDDCQTAPLWSERVFAVLPNGHALAGKKELRWSDIACEPFLVSDRSPGPEIRAFLVQRLAGLGHLPKIHSHNIGHDNVLSLVAVSRGMTLTGEAMTMAQIPGVAYRPIIDETVTFSAIWSPQNDNPAARRLLSLARSMARLRKGTLTAPAPEMPAPASPWQSLDPSQ